MTIGTHDTARRCRAHRSNGDACSAYAIRGGTVCVVHGGSAPQVKQSAAQRLAAMVDPLLTELFRIAQASDSDATRLAAIRDALDRAGYKATDKLDVTSQGKRLVTFNIQRAAGTGDGSDA